MLRRIALAAAASLLVFAASLRAIQNSAASATKPKSAHASKTFEPLLQWKSAILEGNMVALQSLYSASTQNQVPQGNSIGPAEEIAFWNAVHSAGLTALDPKVLERDTMPDGQIALVMRVYLTVQINGAAKDIVIGGTKDMVIAVTQLWSHDEGDWKIVATKRSNPGLRPEMKLPEPAVPNTDLYPDPGEAQKDLDAALAATGKDHKNVIVVFGGNWCYDCHVLDATFHSPAIAPLVNANYHVVHINIGDYDQNLALAARLQTVLTKGVPALAVLDSKGNILTSQKNGEFESTVKLSPSDVTDFLKRWKPHA
jgi:thioredoxin 1